MTWCRSLSHTHTLSRCDCRHFCAFVCGYLAVAIKCTAFNWHLSVDTVLFRVCVWTLCRTLLSSTRSLFWKRWHRSLPITHSDVTQRQIMNLLIEYSSRMYGDRPIPQIKSANNYESDGRMQLFPCAMRFTKAMHTYNLVIALLADDDATDRWIFSRTQKQRTSFSISDLLINMWCRSKILVKT